ncbi:hypothetical protein JKP88DRAFT_249845 [Tribonema minus]|uniref:Uncharacterized protein n=1 Tax=Tribonema minus TaxID=303371 RepID=A0A835YSV3_9STRA|nr:hypothetical protein JKP88DRAFT_249845 [Tribonema minus]
MRLLVLALAACAGGSLGFVAPGSCTRNSSGFKGRLPVSISTLQDRQQQQLPVSIRSCRTRRCGDAYLINAAHAWAQLRHLKEEVVGNSTVLQLDAPTVFPGQGRSASQLMIRDAYRDLFDRMVGFLACSGECCILLGSPGIGKSFMLYFIMWLVALEGGTVVYDRFDEDKVLVFTRTHVSKGPATAFGGTLGQPDTWCVLIRGTLWTASNYPFAKTVLVSSPDYKIWKNASKRIGAKIWYMPSWSDEEIMDC